jgi:type II secretory pathway component PulF
VARSMNPWRGWRIISMRLSTRLLVGTSEVVAGGWLWILLLGVLLVMGMRSWLARPGNRRRWHGWRLSWPLVGDIESKYATARFARAAGAPLTARGARRRLERRTG